MKEVINIRQKPFSLTEALLWWSVESDGFRAGQFNAELYFKILQRLQKL